MKAGPALDMRVELEVMGYAATYKDACRKAINKMDGSCGMTREVFEDCWSDPRNWVRFAFKAPPRSTNIASAWEVVEKLQAEGLSVFLSAVGDGNNQTCRIVDIPAAPVPVTGLRDEPVYVGPGSFLSNEQARTMPHAICLAVLQASLPKLFFFSS